MAIECSTLSQFKNQSGDCAEDEAAQEGKYHCDISFHRTFPFIPFVFKRKGASA